MPAMAAKAVAATASTAAKAVPKPKSADPFKYHITDKSPFWKKFREALVVNPDITTGSWITNKFRNPEPGSRPETYSLPPTKANDPAQNAYFQRDFRRQYPRLDVITQTDLSALLLAQPEKLNLPAPTNASAQKVADGVTDLTTLPSPAPSLSSLYMTSKNEAATNSTSQPFYTAFKLPPIPVSGVKLSWSESEERVDRPEYAYFPMDNFSSTVVSQQPERGHDTARTGVTDKVGVDT